MNNNASLPLSLSSFLPLSYSPFLTTTYNSAHSLLTLSLPSHPSLPLCIPLFLPPSSPSPPFSPSPFPTSSLLPRSISPSLPHLLLPPFLPPSLPFPIFPGSSRIASESLPSRFDSALRLSLLESAQRAALGQKMRCKREKREKLGKGRRLQSAHRGRICAASRFRDS